MGGVTDKRIIGLSVLCSVQYNDAITFPTLEAPKLQRYSSLHFHSTSVFLRRCLGHGGSAFLYLWVFSKKLRRHKRSLRTKEGLVATKDVLCGHSAIWGRGNWHAVT